MTSTERVKKWKENGGKSRLQQSALSKYANVDEKVFIETEIARGRSTEEITEGLRERFPKYGLMKDLVVHHVIGGYRVKIVNQNLGDAKKREASVENYEERVEEKEKKYFSKIFDNNLRIENLKEAALKFYEDNPQKIRPKDYKDLTVAQAIGTRDLRDYKVRQAGRLDANSPEELEMVSIKMVEFLMKKKNMTVSPVAVVASVEDKVIDMEETDEGTFEQTVG